MIGGPPSLENKLRCFHQNVENLFCTAAVFQSCLVGSGCLQRVKPSTTEFLQPGTVWQARWTSNSWMESYLHLPKVRTFPLICWEIETFPFANLFQGLAKAVCKATTEEIIGPKKKHLDCKWSWLKIWVVDCQQCPTMKSKLNKSSQWLRSCM